MKSIVKLLPVLLIALAPAAFADNVIYNSVPSPLPPNVASLGYQANQTAEFGDLIQFAGASSSNALTTATVAMSDWAVASDYPAITGTGFNVPLTLSIYAVGAGNTVGALLGSDTVNAFIPWRPEASVGCGTAYLASDGFCYNGSLSTVTFDLAGILAPNQVIYGLSYNTETWGANPIGVDGPYDSLNFGLSSTGATVGSDPLPGTAYWNTETALDYTDHGAGGVGTFRQDTAWAPYTGAIQFDAASPTPEPSSLALLGTGILGLAGAARRRFLRA